MTDPARTPDPSRGDSSPRDACVVCHAPVARGAPCCPCCGSPLERVETAANRDGASTGGATLDLTAATIDFARVDLPRPGALVAGRFEVMGSIGSGSTGFVYRARDRSLNQIVALKVFVTQAPATVEDVERLKREVRTAHTLTHPNIEQVYDFGRHGATPFVSMELLEGLDLARLLARREPFSVQRSLDVARQVCAGLTYAHDAGVTHGDLRPCHVFVTDGGVVKIRDFGRTLGVSPSAGRTAVAEPASPGGTTGTTRSTAQVAAIEPRADIRAVGDLLLAMLGASRSRLASLESVAVTAAHGGSVSPPRAFERGLSQGLEAVISRAHAAGSPEGYGSVADLARDLARLAKPPTVSQHASARHLDGHLPAIAPARPVPVSKLVEEVLGLGVGSWSPALEGHEPRANRSLPFGRTATTWVHLAMGFVLALALVGAVAAVRDRDWIARLPSWARLLAREMPPAPAAEDAAPPVASPEPSGIDTTTLSEPAAGESVTIARALVPPPREPRRPDPSATAVTASPQVTSPRAPSVTPPTPAPTPRPPAPPAPLTLEESTRRHCAARGEWACLEDARTDATTGNVARAAALYREACLRGAYRGCFEGGDWLERIGQNGRALFETGCMVGMSECCARVNRAHATLPGDAERTPSAAENGAPGSERQD